ncbi:unnamed protein product [Prunus armeniaca]|uniref:C2H2-type domain-containing protein n=1 Tax=Prunus armeniaca TaxID=36596 RepID=A0A6J5Y0H5_PRUAR|nr:unnamed protein product [Prunus armeniaca]
MQQRVSIYSSSVWSYASSQGSPNSAATLTLSVRYASATIYLLRGHNSNLPLLSWRNRIQFILLPNLPHLTYQSKHEYREEQVDQQWTIISLKALAMLRGHKLKYLVLVTKRYNCKICNKRVSIYLSSVWSYASSQGFPTQLQPLPATIRRALYGHMHPHKVRSTWLQPLLPGVRYASTSLNFILGRFANRYNCKICNKGFSSTRALYGHIHLSRFTQLSRNPYPQEMGHFSVGGIDEGVADESECHSNSFPTSLISIINQNINTETNNGLSSPLSHWPCFMNPSRNTYIWLPSGITVRYETKGFHLLELCVVICILSRFTQLGRNPYPHVFVRGIDEGVADKSECRSNSFPTSLISLINQNINTKTNNRLSSPLRHWLCFVALSQNIYLWLTNGITIRYATKDFPSPQALYGHMHPHKEESLYEIGDLQCDGFIGHEDEDGAKRL